MNPQDQVSEERLSEVWFDIQEFYYSKTGKQSFDTFKYNLRKVISSENELVSCNAGLKLIQFGDESGYEILKHFGITQRDSEAIEKAILRKVTNLELAKSKLTKGDKKEVISFYKILASVERSLNRQLNLSEINLERWVYYLEEIRAKNEAERQLLNKKKQRR